LHDFLDWVRDSFSFNLYELVSPLGWVFIFSLYFYFASFFALFTNRRNPFLVLIILELQLIILCFLYIIIGFINTSIVGYVFALSIIAFAGAEASVGISLLIVNYRSRGFLSPDPTSVLSE
jgi:NADH:ubiquinone oxidoreductase subunit K